jgi:histidine triad (HIT) family protein
MVTECVFCEIMAGRLPGEFVYQDDLTVAFIDPRQHNPGHVLVVPREHINDIRYLDPQIGAAVMKTLIRITRAVERAFPSEGMSLWHSIGPAAFQEVPHMHVHVHPRRLGDGLLRRMPSACAMRLLRSRISVAGAAGRGLLATERRRSRDTVAAWSEGR